MNQTDPLFPLSTSLALPDAPPIGGLTFRLFAGEADIPALEAVRQQVRAVDGDIWLPGPDTEAQPVCNPAQDCVVAEIAGRMVAYTWLDWWTEVDGTQLYLHLGWVVPAWRRKGIGRALLHWQEQRLRQIASTHQTTGSYMFGGNADESQPANRALLFNEGYQVAFTRVEMVCQIPDEPIELAPLPASLEIRPVEEEQLRAIYTANDEAFQDSRHGYISDSFEGFMRELHWPETDTSLWVVAWDKKQIAGLVISEIDEAGGAYAVGGSRAPLAAARPGTRIDDTHPTTPARA